MTSCEGWTAVLVPNVSVTIKAPTEISDAVGTSNGTTNQSFDRGAQYPIIGYQDLQRPAVRRAARLDRKAVEGIEVRAFGREPDGVSFMRPRRSGLARLVRRVARPFRTRCPRDRARKYRSARPAYT